MLSSSAGTKLSFSRNCGSVGKRWILLSSEPWASTTICSRPDGSPAPMGICQAGPKNRPMSGCMKAIRRRPPETPIATGWSFTNPSFSRAAVAQSSSICAAMPSTWAAGRPALSMLCRMLDRVSWCGKERARMRENTLEQRQIHRPRHVRAEQVVLGIRDRRRDRADVAAAAADRLDDVGQIVLALGVVVADVSRYRRSVPARIA